MEGSGTLVLARKIVRWPTLTINNSKAVLNIKQLITTQVFMLDMLSFEVKLILRVSSPLSRFPLARLGRLGRCKISKRLQRLSGNIPTNNPKDSKDSNDSCHRDRKNSISE